MGYTHGAREGVIARRPAAIQVSFKGYMSTTGSPHVTHIITDAPSVPPEAIPYYSERQMYLSPVFSASTHAINHPEALNISASLQPSLRDRVDAGLPERGFVYACFNSLYKVRSTLEQPLRGSRSSLIRVAPPF